MPVTGIPPPPPPVPGTTVVVAAAVVVVVVVVGGRGGPSHDDDADWEFPRPAPEAAIRSRDAVAPRYEGGFLP
jgi:energy-converting hydrogenase Eha subunit F